MKLRLSDWASLAEIVASIAVVITLILLVRATFRTFEKAYFAYQYGTVGAREYSRFDAQTCNHFDMIGERSWSDVNTVLTDDFRSHVESLCAEGLAVSVGR